MTLLIKIKRAVLSGGIVFTDKATTERERDSLSEQDVIESILNAAAIYKTLKSQNPDSGKRGHLHVIQSPNLTGVFVYSKGKLVEQGGVSTYYVLISSKVAE